MRGWLLLLVVLGGCREPVAPAAPKAPPPQPAAPPAAAPDASPSVVTLVCPDREVPAFFIAPDRLVARGACDSPKVRLRDGRNLLGRTLKAQKDLDLWELEVVGGEGEPIPIGESMALQEADDVSIPGGPRGTVRALQRSRLGVPHIEVAFDRLPAPGAPVVDTQGRAVGLVTDATLVLPIEALGPKPKWALLVERNARPLAEEVAALKSALQKPGLASALVDPSGALHAVLLSRTPAPEVKLTLGSCTPTLKPQWEPFRMNAWYDPATHELFQFIDKHDLDVGLSMSTVALPAGACQGIELYLDRADPLLHQVHVGKTSQPMVATAPSGAAPPPPAQARAGSSPLPPIPMPDEREWRGRFRGLRDEQERFERELRDKQRFIEQADRSVRYASRYSGQMLPVLSPDDRMRYDQYKRDLETADAERAAFQRRLDDLEREASNASVPREWRR